MPRRVISAPSSGTDTHDFMESVRERRLIIKPRLNRYVDQRHGGLGYQFFGMLNAMLNQPLVSGGAERSFE